MTSTPEPFTPQLTRLVEQLGQFFEQFGFRRVLGRVWGTLYVSAEPVDQNELRERLDISAGLVSSTLKELEHWGMVRTVSLPGTRRVHYTAELHLMRVVTSVLSKRELSAVRSLREAAAAARWHDPSEADTRHLAPRLQAIEEVADLYEALADIVFLIAKLPSGVLRAAVEGLRALREIDPWVGGGGMG